MAVLHRDDGIDDDEFLIALAEALVLSGLAMATAGSSRPCSGGDHEILHAIDHLFPGTAWHGELAGAASLFVTHLRGDARRSPARSTRACAATGCRACPRDLGLTEEQFARGRALRAAAPGRTATRSWSTSTSTSREVRERVRAYVEAFDR